MNGALAIFTKLYNNSTVQLITSSRIAIGTVEPDWPISAKGCMIYQDAPINHALEYYNGSFTVNCRASTEYEADELAEAVITALNRHLSGTAFCTCQKLQVIKPFDETDNFNVPVNVTVKGTH